MWWLSYVATIMSFAYAFIGLGLAIGKTTEKGHPDYGTAWGMAHQQPSINATWNTFNALGSMAYAYSFVRPSLGDSVLSQINLTCRQVKMTGMLERMPSNYEALLLRSCRLPCLMQFYLFYGKEEHAR